jgi:hypothetical protein
MAQNALKAETTAEMKVPTMQHVQPLLAKQDHERPVASTHHCMHQADMASHVLAQSPSSKCARPQDAAYKHASIVACISLLCAKGSDGPLSKSAHHVNGVHKANT